VLRRSLVGGYRVADVEVALAELRFALAHLELEVQAATGARTASEQTVTRLRQELSAAEARAAEAVEARVTLRRERDEMAESARRSVAAAQEDALAARKEAADALRFRADLSETLSRLAQELRGGAATTTLEPRAEPTAQEPSPSLVGPLLALDAGPFTDLADVLLFEHALRELPNVTDVYLREFEQERAHVEVSVAQPVRLVEDIAARLPFSVDVTPGDSGSATLTVYPLAREA
jgi:multidrug efflux pump subunit AcrA (membrane-fusion protein)